MIMTYLAVLLYPFVYKAKTARHRDFNMEGVSLLDILIWVHYKGMWIKNLPHVSY